MGMLGMTAEQVKVKNMLVGGGFGGKEDVTVQHHAALIAWLSKRPVKVKLTRAESILIHPKRHPMDMEFTLGCDENGIIQGVKASVVADTGAYASLGGPVLERACTHAAGPYNYQNFEIDGWAWYTNNPPAGAFRGFGVTQTCFCIESLMNRMADKVGISSGTGTAQRTDRGRFHRPCRDAPSYQTLLRFREVCGHCLRHEERRRGRRHPGHRTGATES